MQPSSEQQAVVDALKEHNVVVDSVAGSGKTTTVMFIAQKYKNSRILLLTYNNALAKETNNKLKTLDIKNLTVRTYHSFAGHFYGMNCRNDKDMNNIIEYIRESYEKDETATQYHVLILDEVQDLTPTYYEFVCLYLRDYPAKRYAIIGDVNQNIYGFNRADSRFITHAADLFNFNERSFKHCKLSTSYRITIPMAEFINKVYMKHERLRAIKKGPKVNYLVTDVFKFANIAKKYVVPILDKYAPEDIFIIAPSIRNDNSPVKKLANYISEHQKKKLYVPNSDDEPFDEEAAKGKIAITTFHQVKGRERKCAIVYGLDASYIKFYCKEGIPTTCPNTVYVALTRASEFMLVIHGHNFDFMGFSNPKPIKTIANCVRTLTVGPPKEAVPLPVKIPHGVTELLRHQPSDIISNCVELLSVTQVEESIGKLNIKSKIKDGDFVELVSDITGSSVVIYYELKTRGKSSIIEFYKKCKDKKTRYVMPNFSIQEIIKLSIHHQAMITGYTFRKYQIKQFDFIPEQVLESVVERLNSLNISDNSVYEHYLSYSGEATVDETIRGSLDCVDEDNKTIWEFKFVDAVKDTHFIQLAIYGFMATNTDKKYKDYRLKLYNIRTGEMYELKNDQSAFEKMLTILVESKLTVTRIPVDVDFITMVNSIRENSKLKKIILEPEPEKEYINLEEPEESSGVDFSELLEDLL